MLQEQNGETNGMYVYTSCTYNVSVHEYRSYNCKCALNKEIVTMHKPVK